MQTVTVSLFRYDSWFERHWALWQMLLGKPKLRRLPGVQFVKMVGAGSREGFFPVPDTSVEGVICAWPSRAAAEAQVRGAPVFAAMRRHAAESMTLYLETTRVWGRWAGGEPFAPSPDRTPGAPVVALTRATIKARHALAFWRRTPAIRAEIPDQAHLMFKIGLAEVPWVNQITFTVWDDAEAMRAFAYRAGGPHAQAVEAVRRDGWFSEELYARFRVTGVDGGWSRAPRFDEIAARAAEGPRETAA
jgi:spheroidene monooxygenase